MLQQQHGKSYLARLRDHLQLELQLDNDVLTAGENISHLQNDICITRTGRIIYLSQTSLYSVCVKKERNLPCLGEASTVQGLSKILIKIYREELIL